MMSMLKLIKVNEKETKLAYTGLTTLSPLIFSIVLFVIGKCRVFGQCCQATWTSPKEFGNVSRRNILDGGEVG